MGEYHLACGECCLAIGRPPFLYHDDGRIADRVLIDGRWDGHHETPLPEHMPAALVDELRQLASGRPSRPDLDPLGPRPCVWLDARTYRCRHYAFRPSLCRDFDCGGLKG